MLSFSVQYFVFWIIIAIEAAWPLQLQGTIQLPYIAEVYVYVVYVSNGA